ncbi:hypothetical protein L861_06555 [Litchfieldella anticariensis FP35 = DSM 16096]|uniref:Integrating conjugative element protein n=1 Tax=Litchfieldella anticariensis (strain DSM 16096 / CECT 5854 / CIP 108499 / LMG 22089 / FP35) TaxID=1121939 RepID=S2KFA5_LITA3|nr:TIGR03752 family integrating conjugative element protein [Halomonas anticariensis]EPC00595.1 hypothetical protein L861_06555 [Halomonas anticariensis FP35 = DSM 16096]
MTLKSNSLLKFLVPALVIAVLLIVLRNCTEGSEEALEGTAGRAQAKDPSLTLTDEELKALGVEGDTPRDTVATLVGQVKAMRTDLQRAQDESERLREQNEQLATRNRNVQREIDEALEEEWARQQAELRQQSRQEDSLLGTLQQQLDQLQRRVDGNGNHQELPIGLGLEGGGGPTTTHYDGPGARLKWVDPLDAPGESNEGHQGETAFPTSFRDAAKSAGEALNRTSTAMESRVTGEPDASNVEPVYTLPENSTLMGSVAMTALLGRVPIDGTVNDPYPFKAIIGRDNLTANGVELPEVQSAVVSGSATGDWTLSCVWGQITSLTFVFEDGTIRTLPTPEDVNEASGNRGDSTRIGWISDPHGLPCVPGERKTNARQFLLTSFILGAAEGAADAMALGETTQSTNALGGTTSSVTGDAGKYAASAAMASGVSDVREWVQQRFGQTFDAVYVPPGQPVAIHIEKALPIDYETKGRRVRYERHATVVHELP